MRYGAALALDIERIFVSVDRSQYAILVKITLLHGTVPSV